MKGFIFPIIIGILIITGCSTYTPGHFVDEGGSTYVTFDDGTKYELPSGGSDSE